MGDLVTRNWADIARKVVGAVIGVGVIGTGGALAGADQVVLWLWNGVFGFGGSGGEMPAAVGTWIGAILSSGIGAFVGGWLPKESLPSAGGGAVLKSPPFVTGAAFALALAVVLALSACASFSVPKDATFEQRLDAAQTDLGTADLFINLYAGFPECGASVPQPCRVAVVVTVLQRGSDGVREAIAATRKLIAEKSPEGKILVAIQLVQQKLLELMQARDRAATTAPGALMASAPPG